MILYCACSYRTLESTNSVCNLAVEYTKYKTIAEATAALLNVGVDQYPKVSKPKENLCVVFGPFSSVLSEDLRVVLCGGTKKDLLEPTKFFRTVVGNPSPKGYVGDNYATYLKRLSDMGILGQYVFEKVEEDEHLQLSDHADSTDVLIEDTSFHLRSLFWDNSTIGFTYLILGNLFVINDILQFLLFLTYYADLILYLKDGRTRRMLERS